MTKFKTQKEKGVALAFRHLDVNCHLGFDIWILANGFWNLEFSQGDCHALFGEMPGK